MSDSLMLFLVLGPGLALAVVIGFLTRNDPISAKAIEQLEKNPFYRIERAIGVVLLPIVILIGLNNLFGALLLIVCGFFLVTPNKRFPDMFWIKGILAKIFGIVYLSLGFYIILSSARDY